MKEDGKQICSSNVVSFILYPLFSSFLGCFTSPVPSAATETKKHQCQGPSVVASST